MMKIKQIKTYLQAFELTRPYKVAYKTQTTAENVIVEILTEDGYLGLGAGAPATEVTGETLSQCLTALMPDNLSWCMDKNICDFQALKQSCYTHLSKTPAACAAVDIALHDLYAQVQKKPLVELLGQVHSRLPTSITIGIKSLTETLEEAKEYIDRGFKILKVKLGCDLVEDIERLFKIREHFGSSIQIRVDPNQGYSLEDLKVFFDKTASLNIEFVEQPIKASNTSALYELSEAQRNKIALDESLLTVDDAIKALIPTPCSGIFNIKLMKCGGIYGAQKIAKVAHQSKIDLMWGCMDESIISIAAALHVAFSSRATRYLDLDGSFDLAKDIVNGGFYLEDGFMSCIAKPGLGLARI